MSDSTFELAIRRWKDHLIRNRYEEPLHLVLHGGEPLLAGPKRLDRWMTFAKDQLGGDFSLSIGVQTNGLLLDDEICEVFDRHSSVFGVSIDGIPGESDLDRVDHSGQPSGLRLEEKLHWLRSSKWSHTFGGVLSVVNILSDPIRTLEYILTFSPKVCDFRFPLYHHDNLPPRPPWDQKGIAYGKWLEAIFDYAVDENVQCQIRSIDALINSTVNVDAYQNLIGNTELTQACVIETDGSYELPDNLKSTKNGITKTALDVKSNTFDEYCEFTSTWATMNGITYGKATAQKCISCEVKKSCAGHYYANRYGKKRDFRNESVYCEDLRYVLKHIGNKMNEAEFTKTNF